jgi:hypothetical protein
MGLFSPKKTIVVSSTVYNMAGDEADRVNFLKASLFGAVISDFNPYIGDTIVRNHLTGPGIKQRSFFNWAKRNDFEGLPSLSIRSASNVDAAVVSGEIAIPASPAGLENVLYSAFIQSADFTYFTEQYILQNYPDRYNTDYASEYNLAAHTITISYEDTTVETIPAGAYDVNAEYVIARFFQEIPASVQPVVPGTLVINQDEVDLPDDTGFTQDSVSNTGLVTHSLAYAETVTKTYSDATPQDGPTTTAVTESINYNGIETVSSKTEYLGSSSGQIQTVDLLTQNYVFERREIVSRVSTTTTTNDMGGGVTETVVTEIDGDHLDPIFDYRVDTQETINSEVFGGQQIFIYELGSGNAVLDALQVEQSVTATAEFFPYIPIRINNKSIKHADYDDTTGNGLYDSCVTAYRRASGNSFSKIVDEVEDNDDLGDIDYAYITYGVSLNTKDNSCRKYAYQFFKEMVPYQNTSAAYVQGFKDGLAGHNTSVQDRADWISAQSDPANPLFGAPEPVEQTYADPKTTTIKLKTDDGSTSPFDNRLTWVSIDEEFFTGVGKVDAVKGDLWFEKGGTFTWSNFISMFNQRRDLNNIEEIYLYWQTEANTYKRLTIFGLQHRNYIYGGKYVQITGFEALDDESESGLILPLHNPTLRAMSIVDYTQMATANTFIVFNSYEVFKKKWYQTFLGMLLIIAVVVAATVLLNPAAAASASGILGGNVAVGSALGLTGTSAIVAGAVANAIAAAIVAKAVSDVAVSVFGPKWGAIIAAAVSFAIGFGAGGGFNNFNLSTALTPQNLLAFSSSVANGYSGFVAADIAEMNAEMMQMGEDFNNKVEDINDLIRDLGGANDLAFDPMQLTDVNAGNESSSGSYVPESLDEFIHRTTMTGSDIVDVTLSMVENYADLNLQLPEN